MDTDTAIERLRAMEPDLRALGIKHVSLFGSRARNVASTTSDFDLALEFGRDREIGGFAFADLGYRLEQALASKVDLVIEPARKARLQREIDRDRKRVF
ncbi:nucleotidyltransferase family protein [Erythrobacter sp. HL-111]|uniref:nucleotidyltransferase family protein n=1 Tax=Erythrobacter sp. HL-111 TaxID=1798193 RepID=UPI0006DA9FB1|nr:nucleotidyltransferase domain-containing protein [Erythrobacter sp. HL-111]KPP85254.1 MAG: putative nucleotidyltransferase [Erythrobacteraceae bacterium HL-111]SDS22605.1 hypothetical protein SAMN04515621_1184 [Erythrobacter sp. HL-111]